MKVFAYQQSYEAAALNRSTHYHDAYPLALGGTSDHIDMAARRIAIAHAIRANRANRGMEPEPLPTWANQPPEEPEQ